MANEGTIQIKSYFETGDTPTQGEFVNLIDSLSQKLYENTRAYISGEFVIIDNSGFKGYLCITDTTAGESPITTPGKWDEVGVGGGGTSGIDAVLAIAEALTADRVITGDNAYRLTIGSTTTADRVERFLAYADEQAAIKAGDFASDDYAEIFASNSLGIQKARMAIFDSGVSSAIDILVASMLVTDEINQKGLAEAADYSANKTAFSYATKKMLNWAFNAAYTFKVISDVESLAADRTVVWPDKNGTVAMTSDIGGTNTLKTIGSGGDYATINAAITAGQSDLKLIANVTELSNITLTEDTRIDLNGFTLTMGVFKIDISSVYQINIFDGTIDFTYASAGKLFTSSSTNRFNTIVKNCTINNNSTATDCVIANNGYFESITTSIPLFGDCGFGVGGGSFEGVLKNSEIIGIGSYPGLLTGIQCGKECSIENLTISGTFTNAIIGLRNARNVYITATGINRVRVADSSNVYDRASTQYILMEAQPGDGAIFGCEFYDLRSQAALVKLVGCRFLNPFTISGDKNKFTDCFFDGIITITGDHNSFLGCDFGTANAGSKTLSIGATADKTIITNSRTEAAIVDAGTNTISANNQLF